MGAVGTGGPASSHSGAGDASSSLHKVATDARGSSDIAGAGHPIAIDSLAILAGVSGVEEGSHHTGAVLGLHAVDRLVVAS